MFKNILIPTDLSENSLRALDIALKVCSSDAMIITLLHVIETIEGAEDNEFRPFYEKLEQRALRKMRKILAHLGPEDGYIHTQILYGRRVREIVTYALDKSIDLIVLRSHKINSTDPVAGWATISYRVAILAHCPVLIVK